MRMRRGQKMDKSYEYEGIRCKGSVGTYVFKGGIRNNLKPPEIREDSS